MATPTYDLLDSTTLTSSASSVTFSGISGTGKGDLVLVANVKATAGVDSLLRFNSDTGSNYSWVRASGNGSSAASFANTTDGIYLNAVASFDSTNFNSVIVQIMDYAATNKHKSVLSRANNASLGVEMGASRWANTAAITTIEFRSGSSTQFVANSTFHLYQIVSE